MAQRLEQEIRAMGWPVGFALGSESELTERFGVGVAAIREASRILTARGIARSRRGPGGGMFVIAPDRQMVTDVARLYLERTGVGRAELFDAWCAFEQTAVASLAATIDAAGAERLRALVKWNRSASVLDVAHIHLEIARLAGNKVLELFINTVAELAMAPGGIASPARGGTEWWQEAHVEFIESIIAGDVARAQLHLGRVVEHLKHAGGRPRRWN